MALKPGDPGAGPTDPQNPPPGAFDPKAFSEMLLGEIDKRINALDKKINGVVKSLEPKPADPAAPPPADPAAPPAEPKEARTIAELNIELASLRKKTDALVNENAAEKKARELAEEKQRELARMSAIDAVLNDLPFPSPKAKQQFRDAYQGKVKRDEDGTYIVESEKGPLGFDIYLKSEFDESPHFAARAGHSGAGATPGQKPGGSSKLLDVLNMTTAQILAAPKEQVDAALAAAIDSYEHAS